MIHIPYLIVGNGVAGIAAAQEIRRADAEGRILIVSDEGEPYYYRASLSEWMAGETTDEMLPGRTPAFYEQMRLEQITDRVTRVDAAAREAVLENGAPVRYQKLLLATGARANRFAIEGLDPFHVYRTLEDVRAIRQEVGCCGRALILGGGILGLELAGALYRMGQEAHRALRIAVVHRRDHVGAPLLDSSAAEWLQDRMRADGIELFLADTVERVTEQRAQLKSGRWWAFDTLIEAVGISPTFPEVEGLIVGRGIQIDAQCRTNLPDVYAAGDCTETRAPGRDCWQTTRIWLECARQGKTAGRNMAADGASGRRHALPRTPFYNASLIYTVFYACIGEPHGEGGEVHLWQAGDGYRKVRVVDGKLAGALLLGERHGAMALLLAIGQPVASFGSRIAHPDFAFNELTGRDWDYMWY